MQERTIEALRLLPRHELEGFAAQALQYLGRHRRDAEMNRIFMAMLTGFVLGAVVAAAGFMAGSSLS